jgi:hypothetical protein
MKFTPLKFILLSLGIHVLGFLVISEHPIFEKTAAIADVYPEQEKRIMYAGIFPENKIHEPDDVPGEVKGNESLVHPANDSAAKTAAHPLLNAGKPAQEDAEAEVKIQDYFKAGKLTLLPSPITNIDLDVAEIKEVAVPGMVRLIILIDADGMVTQVISTSEDEASRVFSERVTEIFKRARFSPGEVNGMAVKAQLEIDIVSETIHTL